MKILFDQGNKNKEIDLLQKERSVFFFSIRLRNVKESFAGFYTCEVSNGFETLTSTGFVRVKNPGFQYHIFCFYFLSIVLIIIIDINPIDLNDDLLVIEFFFMFLISIKNQNYI